jgi:hypothetical protein
VACEWRGGKRNKEKGREAFSSPSVVQCCCGVCQDLRPCATQRRTKQTPKKPRRGREARSATSAGKHAEGRGRGNQHKERIKGTRDQAVPPAHHGCRSKQTVAPTVFFFSGGRTGHVRGGFDYDSSTRVAFCHIRCFPWTVFCSALVSSAPWSSRRHALGFRAGGTVLHFALRVVTLLPLRDFARARTQMWIGLYMCCDRGPKAHDSDNSAFARSRDVKASASRMWGSGCGLLPHGCSLALSMVSLLHCDRSLFICRLSARACCRDWIRAAHCSLLSLVHTPLAGTRVGGSSLLLGFKRWRRP